MCDNVISLNILLISPFQLSFPISSRLFPILREVFLWVFDVKIPAPQHKVWMELSAPYTNVSARYPRTFHFLLLTFFAASSSFEKFTDALIPAYTPVQFS